jgi:hypothetical protein
MVPEWFSFPIVQSKITLSNLLKAHLISAGDEILYKDEEGIILGDGWIEHGQDKHPDPDAWVHEVRQDPKPFRNEKITEWKIYFFAARPKTPWKTWRFTQRSLV